MEALGNHTAEAVRQEFLRTLIEAEIASHVSGRTEMLQSAPSQDQLNPSEVRGPSVGHQRGPQDGH